LERPQIVIWPIKSISDFLEPAKILCKTQTPMVQNFWTNRRNSVWPRTVPDFLESAQSFYRTKMNDSRLFETSE
jgi:hypothetical protein